MSEPSNQSAAPEPAGNGDMINWGDPAPAATEQPNPEPAQPATPEPPATPPAEAPKTAEPATPPPAQPTPAEDIAFVTLQNGEKELRLVTGEVYRGKDDADLARKIAQGKLEANRHISQLKNAPQPVTNQPNVAPQATNATPAALDPATVALADMMAPALGLKNGQELIEAWQGLNQKVQSYEQQAVQQQQNAVAAEFMREAGDFVVTPGNIDRFSEQFEKTGLPFTKENAMFVHHALKGMGAYEQVQPQQMQAQAPRTATGQFAPRMPLPPAPSNAAANVQTEEAWGSDADFAKFIQEYAH